MRRLITTQMFHFQLYILLCIIQNNSITIRISMRSHVSKVLGFIGCLNGVFTVYIVLLVLNKIIKELSSGANITKIQSGGGGNSNNPSTSNSTAHKMVKDQAYVNDLHILRRF